MLSDLHVRYLLVPALVFIAQASDTGYLADFWHHLARGEVILETGELLNHDIFTFTVRGQPFQDVNWLTQCLYAWLFGLGGLALVQVVNAFVLALTLGLLVHLCRRTSGSLVIAMSVGLVTFLGLWQVLSIRPQTFSLLFFVLFLHALERSLTQPRWVLALPPIMVLWTNMHGAFPAGIFLIGCYGLAELIRAVRAKAWTPRLTWLTIALIGALLATLASPYGWEIYRYVGLTSQRSAGRGIDEWLPPSLDQWVGVAFFVSLGAAAAVFAIAWAKARHVPRLEEVILLVFFLPLAATSIRMTAWWLIVLSLPLSGALVALLPQARDGEAPAASAGATATVIVLVLLAVFSVPGLARLNPLMSWKGSVRTESHLEAALERLKEGKSSGRIFARLEWGEYLGWRGWPDFPVFVDGRIEIYPDEVWDAFKRVTTGADGWEDVLKEYEVDVLVLDRDYHAKLGLLDKVKASPRWRESFVRGPVVVFLRVRSGPTEPVISTYN